MGASVKMASTTSRVERPLGATQQASQPWKDGTLPQDLAPLTLLLSRRPPSATRQRTDTVILQDRCMSILNFTGRGPWLVQAKHKTKHRSHSCRAELRFFNQYWYQRW